ncbi:hypothetical protein niasHT_018389 [Heterodera trifolii]|uniref:Fido domain-containing protein n=1 Tax=Heterodera trifolii TaxID=157864 RepID=A0ABD2LDD7_9BILA
MKEFCRWLKAADEALNGGGGELARFVATVHRRIIQIHPAEDGNGCLARLLMNVLLKRMGKGPIILRELFHDQYDECMRTGNIEAFVVEINVELNNLEKPESKFEADGTVGMDIVNYDGKALPIPPNPLPKKVVGFKAISFKYFNNNAIAFPGNFRQLFATCPINLTIDTFKDRILEFFLHNIWPMIARNIHGIQLSAGIMRRLGKFGPSILNDCPSLRVFNSYECGLLPKFPADDSAAASDGQMLAKWLITPSPDNVPKVFKSWIVWNDGHLASRIRAFKAVFASASSAVNFIAVIRFPTPFADSVLLFDLTNELTREQLTLKRMNDIGHFLLIRCPIVREEKKMDKMGGGSDWMEFYGSVESDRHLRWAS